MPCNGYSTHPYDIDPRRWARCRAEARRQLLAAGFEPLSAKLDDAVRKRAHRLWAQGGGGR